MRLGRTRFQLYRVEGEAPPTSSYRLSSRTLWVTFHRPEWWRIGSCFLDLYDFKSMFLIEAYGLFRKCHQIADDAFMAGPLQNRL